MYAQSFPNGLRQVLWSQLSGFIGPTRPAPWNDQSLLNLFSANVSGGYLSIHVDFAAIASSSVWSDGNKERCGPKGFCSWNDTTGSCGCSRLTAVDPFAYPELSGVCEQICSMAGGVYNQECPAGGCMGFVLHLPKGAYVPPVDYDALTVWPVNVPAIQRVPFSDVVSKRSLKALASDGQCP